LPYRIAPSAIAVVAPPTITAPSSAGMPIMSAFDTDMPQSGSSTDAPIIVSPPTDGNSGTLIC
jgi:hypothetical protein